MSRQFATLECLAVPSPALCSIRVRYSDVPRTFTSTDFGAGGTDCHLVHAQPAPNRRSMEIHFTGCQSMLVDLQRALDVHHIETEGYLLCSFAGEFRQAGLVEGMIDEFLDLLQDQPQGH